MAPSVKGLKLNDSSRWVREHAAWAYEVAQQERSCREVYRQALQTRDLFRISAVFEEIKPALSLTARWWHRKIEKEEFGVESQDIEPKLAALHYRFWDRWGDSIKTKGSIEVFERILRDHYRGEKLSAGSIPRIALGGNLLLTLRIDGNCSVGEEKTGFSLGIA